MSGSTDNSVVIDAPMQFVWDRTNDIDGWSELYSEYAESTVLDRDGDTVRFRLTLHPDDAGRSWSWVSERTADPQRRRTWSRRIEMGPFAYMFLYWEYSDTDDGVRMRWVQHFEMEPWAPLDDAGMTERLNTNTRREMARIKSILETEHRVRSSDARHSPALEGTLS